MLNIGHWSGFFKFNNQNMTKARGFERTFFDLEIVSINGNEFSGRVQDDKATGGMEGLGEVVGRIEGDRIEFVKTMPKMTLIVDQKGTRKTLDKKHRPIYYSGQISNDGQSAKGTWRFKFGIIWMGIIPMPMPRSSGTWEMTKKS